MEGGKMEENVKQDTTYEYNSYQYTTTDIFNAIFQCGVYDYFNKEEIRSVLRNPIENHETAIRLSNFVYTKTELLQILLTIWLHCHVLIVY